MEENVGLRYPLNAQIEVTEDCNHHCFYCYNPKRIDSRKDNKMTLDNATKLSKIVIEDVKPFGTVITGGEPMSNMPATLELINQFTQSGISCSLNTNLSLANKERIKQLKKSNKNLRFLVSVPSMNLEIFREITQRETLSKVLENLIILSSEGLETTVNMVMNRLNINEVYKQGSFLSKNYGIKNIATTPALRPSFKQDHEDLYLNREEVIFGLRELLRLKEDFGMNVSVLRLIPYCALPEDLRKIKMFRRGCSAGRTGLQIGYRGDVRACGHSPENIGNLFEEPFSELWKKLEPFRENNYVPQECGDCTEVKYCMGGCRYEGLKDLDKINKIDSRMTNTLKVSLASGGFEPLDENKIYKVSDYKTREETPGVYTLFNGKVFTTNKSMVTFIEDMKRQGFRLNSFPEDIRPLAKSVGQKLKSRGFLK